MCSSSTASATTPFAPASSASRIRAACISAAAAVRSDASSCWDMRCPTAKNSPPPSSARIDTKIPAYHAVSRSRRPASDCISAASGTEPVAGPAQRSNQLRLEAVVDLASQPSDQHLEQVGKRVMVVVPHMRGNGGAVEDAAPMQHEQLQQGELLRTEGNRPAAALHLAGPQIDFEVGNPMSRRRQGRPAARQRLEAGDQLSERERFGEIVVRPHLKPAHPVVDTIERRQHQYGRRIPPTPELAAQVEPGAP